MFDFELNNDVTKCAVCNTKFNEGDKFSFIITESVKLPTESLQLTVKVVHDKCLTGFKKVEAFGRLYRKQT